MPDEIFAETIDNDGVHHRLGQDWEAQPSITVTPERGETIVCGFRIEWISGSSPDGDEFSMECGAGVASPWLTLSYENRDGVRVNERIDGRSILQQWVENVRSSLGVVDGA